MSAILVEASRHKGIVIRTVLSRDLPRIMEIDLLTADPWGALMAAAVGPTWSRLTEGEEPITQDR